MADLELYQRQIVSIMHTMYYNTGAVGSTSNPAILVSVLKAEEATWNEKIDELIKNYPTETEAEIADRVNFMVVESACNILKPVHKQYQGSNKKKQHIVNLQSIILNQMNQC